MAFVAIEKIVRKVIDAYFRCNTMATFKVNRVIHGNYSIVKGRIYIRNRGRIVAGDNLRINSGKRFNPIGGDTVTRFITDATGTISIGHNVGISNSTICCRSSVTIEDCVLIGGSCKIYDSDFHSMDADERAFAFLYGNDGANIKTLPVVIRQGAWIGGNCMILKGVTVGEKSIVGAGSVVARNIPPGEIWGGNPVRFIRKI